MSLAPPSGSRDFLPQELRRRERALARVARIFALHGFEPVATPAFERIDTLSGKYGEEGDKLIFRILKRGPRAAAGEADLALRYDLTVPGARVYAHRRGELPRVFKRYQIGPVWRGERPGKGRFREFTQCDVDIFGAESRLADVAVIVALAAALDALGVCGATVRLNSRAVLAATMESYGVPSGVRAGALTSLDKLDKIGVDGVAEELRERGVPHDAADALRRDVGGGEFAAALRRRLADSPGARPDSRKSTRCSSARRRGSPGGGVSSSTRPSRGGSTTIRGRSSSSPPRAGARRSPAAGAMTTFAGSS